MLASTEKDNISSQIPFFSANSNVDLYNQYSLKIVIESILWIKDLQDNNITISFCNPIYQKFYTIPNPINIQINEFTYLDNIQCRVNVEISSDQVQNIFANWSPAIIICNKENTVLTHCNLDLKMFKFHKSKQRIFLTKSLYAQNDEHVKLADINIILTAYDNKIKVSQQTGHISLPIFFQISEQLEIWKEKQKQLFKIQEQTRINTLLDEWKIEKSKLQERLLKNIQETNNVLQEIKSERDTLKTAIKAELNKRNISLNPNNTESLVKTVVKKKENIKQTNIVKSMESRQLDELKIIIKKQTAEIKALKAQHESSSVVENLVHTLDDLKSQVQMKESESNYFKKQWAKTIREFNSYKKQHNLLTEVKQLPAHDAMLPFMIQQLLDQDAAEQESDLEQLHLIRKELKETQRKVVQFTEDVGKNTEVDLLLKTKTYNKNDKLIKLLSQKK